MGKISQIKEKINAWWTFNDDPTGVLFTDAHNGYTLAAPDGENVSVGTGVTGTAVRFLGTGTPYLINTGDKLKLGPRDFGVSFWFQLDPEYFENNGQVCEIFGLMSDLDPFGTAKTELRVKATYGVADTLEIEVGGGTVAIDNVSYQFDRNNGWFHVVFNYFQSNNPAFPNFDQWYQLYVNGQFIQQAWLEEPHVESGFRLAVNSDENGNQIANYDTGIHLDELLLTTSALDINEVEWLYNSGDGNSYDDIPTAAEEETDCANAIVCEGEDLYAYDSSTATEDEGSCEDAIACCDEDPYAYAASSSKTNTSKDYLGLPPTWNEPCSREIIISTTPPTGGCYQFPLYVALFADEETAQIYFTTDGSDPETSESGTTLLYTGPFSIPDSTVTIKARPVIEECDEFPVQTFQFDSCFPVGFTFLCTNTDKVGPWGVWTPDGGDDHNWNIGFNQQADRLGIKRIEIYELDQNLEWTTGQAWATDTPIYPFKNDPDKEFDVYPLQVWEGGSPINSEYRPWFEFIAATNIFVAPNDLSNANWAKVQVTYNSNADIAPNGLAEAEEIKETTGSIALHYVLQYETMADDLDVHISAWLKPSGRNWASIWFRPNSGTPEYYKMYVDLSTGKVGTVVKARDCKAKLYDNGWCYVSMIANTESGGVTTPMTLISTAQGDNDAYYNGDTNKGIYIWNPQWNLTTEVIGDKDWDLYGDIRQAAPIQNYFQIRMITEQYGTVDAITTVDNCTTPPVICPSPGLTLATGCDGSGRPYVDATTSNPHGTSSTYKLYRSMKCIGQQTFTLIYNGSMGPTSADVYRDANLPNDCEIHYESVVTNATTECQGSTGKIVITTPERPLISLNADVTNPVEGDTVTFEIISDNHDCTGTIQLELNYEDTGWGALTTVPSNTVATYWTSSLAVGTNEIRATACNDCDSVIATVTIEVQPDVAACPPDWQSYNLHAFITPQNLIDAGGGGCTASTVGVPWWDGTINPEATACWYTSTPAKISTTTDFEITITAVVRFFSRIIVTSPAYDGPGWILSIRCPEQGKWAGYKTQGNVPIGTYTNAGVNNLAAMTPSNYYQSPSTIPATIDVEAL